MLMLASGDNPKKEAAEVGSLNQKCPACVTGEEYFYILNYLFLKSTKSYAKKKISSYLMRW